MTGSGPALWTTPAWRAEATAWLDVRLAEAGRRRTGAVEQPRVRPWGTVLRAPTDGGDVWLKAPAPVGAFEVGLYRVLAERVPDDVVRPLGTDPDRGWVLLPDAGASLHDVLSGDALAAAFAAALVRFGAMQRALAGSVDRMLAVGVADMRPAVMPARFDAALASTTADAAARGDTAAERTLDRVAAARRAHVDRCDRLAASAVAASLDHNDLHTGNVMVAAVPPGGGRRVYVDWGDAVVAHPFAVLLIARRVLRQLLGEVADDDPRVVAVVEEYLAGFVPLAPGEDLAATAALAVEVGAVARALVWERALRTATAAGERVSSEWARAPLEYLAELADGPP